MLKTGGGGVNNTAFPAQALRCRRERGPQAALLIHVFSDLVLLQ